MVWEVARYKRYDGRKLKPIPLQKATSFHNGIPGTCTIKYAGWDDWFLVYTQAGEYLVRAQFHEILPYIMEEGA